VCEQADVGKQTYINLHTPFLAEEDPTRNHNTNVCSWYLLYLQPNAITSTNAYLLNFA